MAQFTCPVCNQGFDQKSRLERHLETAHPRKAPSAADVESSLKGVQYPKTKQDLVRFAQQNNAEQGVLELLKQLPDQTYRDSAEVGRAIGQLKTHEEKPTHQPSKRGGEEAMKSVSAAAVAKAFSGATFPKTAKDLKNYVHQQDVREEIVDVVEQLPEKTYRDMAEVEKEVGVVMR